MSQLVMFFFFLLAFFRQAREKAEKSRSAFSSFLAIFFHSRSVHQSSTREILEYEVSLPSLLLEQTPLIHRSSFSTSQSSI